MFSIIKHILLSENIRKKILFTLAIIFIYRLFVVIPVPFVNIEVLKTAVSWATGGMEFFAMLMWWTLEKFSIIALWLIPFINASIIMQLLTVVVPKLEELKEEWEAWNLKIQQYTRWLTFPLAFLQSIWMVYLIETYINWVIDVNSFMTVLWAAFTLTVGTILLIWLWEMITEKGVANGISLIIFASIVSGMTNSFSTALSVWSSDIISVLIFILLIVCGLIVLSILLIRTRKEIPIIYAKSWKIHETSVLPLPLNPVWMIPIIFAIAFISFPYLLVNILARLSDGTSEALAAVKTFVENYLNIYTPNPHWIVVILYFLLIVMFTFFYSWVVFRPERMAEQIQKRWWYVPGIRPGEETAKYLNDILMHLCFWWGIGLGIIGIYTYIINWIPFVQSMVTSGWLQSLPVIVSGAGIIIIVGVVQELINRINADLLMEKYSKIV